MILTGPLRVNSLELIDPALIILFLLPVLAECKQLGLEEENLMGKPRRRRRRNQRSLENYAKDKTTSSAISNGVIEDSIEGPPQKRYMVDCSEDKCDKL